MNRYSKYLGLIIIILGGCRSTYCVKINCFLDNNYIQWLNEVYDCDMDITQEVQCTILRTSGENTYVRETYTSKVANIYFEGNKSKGIKLGTWYGYINGNLIIQTGYFGFDNNNPAYVKVWNSAGEVIRFTRFSIID